MWNAIWHRKRATAKNILNLYLVVIGKRVDFRKYTQQPLKSNYIAAVTLDNSL